ncbi:MAG: pyridoxal phosphate-dependent transferase [Benniella sp.]|nr:MAG: pyridoxal phosphate-dependent transferase [Benniella sp.]
MTLQNLSVRAQENLQDTNVMLEGVIRANSNKFHIKTNPTGIINLGVAENQLMTRELSEIMAPVNTVDPKLFGYGDSPSGSKLLRRHFANNIFNRYFNPHEPVHAEHMVLTAGCSAAVDNFTFCVCDPGDGILITTPFYGGFNTDIMTKSKAKVVVAHLGDVSPFDVAHVELMQQAVDKATAEGTRVRAFVLSNPHNPLGRNYSRKVIIEFLKFASKNRLHILFDEIYALSVFDQFLTGAAKDEQPDRTPFISVLSLPNIEDYCPRELVHVAYGVSKDFCLNGFRCGCLVSPWNKDLIDAMRSISVFTWIASTTESMLIKLLENPKTIDRFTRTNQKRLAESYTLTVNTLRAHRIPYIPAQGGHFIWIDLRQFIPPSLVNIAATGDRGAEYRLFNAMLDQGVYVNLGEAFTEKKVGFFRLSFSVPIPMLKIGLERLIKACQATLQSLDDRN